MLFLLSDTEHGLDSGKVGVNMCCGVDVIYGRVDFVPNPTLPAPSGMVLIYNVLDGPKCLDSWSTADSAVWWGCGTFKQ